MLTYVALLTSLVITSPRPIAAPRADRPRVEVWTNRGEYPYALGDVVRVMFQTEQDAYVTVLRVDTDGRVRVLFPREPWENNFARSRRIYEVSAHGGSSGVDADDSPGQGYLFAVASADPFTYDPIESDERWNYELIADGGRIRGDPYAALTELAARIVRANNGDWDYDITPYYVQRHYDYPRFLCYDCHTYVSFRTWNPYDYSCVRFRVVVFDDPYYYPYRWYGGTRAVFRRPLRLEPRFIFRDRGASDAFLTRVSERPVNDDRRRDVGVRGRDIGSLGTVPPPRAIAPRGLPDFLRRRDNGDHGVTRDRAGPPDRAVRREGQRPSERARPRPSTPARRPETSGAPQSRRPPATTEPARPRQAPRAEPARPRQAPRAEPARPRQGPRAEPARGGQHQGGRRSEPELRRRKP
jgi:hypothetical protein